MQGWAGRGRKSASGHAGAAAFLPKLRFPGDALFLASLIAWFPTQAFAQDGERLTRLADLGFLTDEPRGIFSTAFVVGLTIFSITVAVLHIRARDFWTRRLRSLSDRAAETETALDRTKLFLNAERQVFVVWAGENEPPDKVAPMPLREPRAGSQMLSRVSRANSALTKDCTLVLGVSAPPKFWFGSMPSMITCWRV